MLRFLQKLETRNVSFYIVQLFFSIKSRKTSRIHLAPSSIFSTITNPIVPEPQKSKKLKFRICSKKVLLKYNLPDNVPLTLLLEHIKMLFNKFGLCSWLIVSEGEKGITPKNQKNIYIFLKCERKVDIKNSILVDFFFNHKLHKGLYNSARSEDMCIESCLYWVSGPLDEKTLLCSPDILVLLSEKPYPIKEIHNLKNTETSNFCGNKTKRELP